MGAFITRRQRLRQWIGSAGQILGVALTVGLCLSTASLAGTSVLTTLYRFKIDQLDDSGQKFDGFYPQARLIYDNKAGVPGALYGTASSGGNRCSAGNGTCGAVFQLKPPVAGQTTWSETRIRVFSGNDGGNPSGPLVADASGALYGTTEYGGIISAPYANLIIGPSNVLYGTTSLGGSGRCVPSNGTQNFGCGTVFSIAPPVAGSTKWTKTTIYNFKGTDGNSYPVDGYYPLCELYRDQAGALFGTTQFGGDANNNAGTVFKLTPPTAGGNVWRETQVHIFHETSTEHDGSAPWAGLIPDGTGNFYGTTSNSGTKGGGGIYKLTAPKVGTVWSYSVLFNLPNAFYSRTGRYPRAPLLRASDGGLFGVNYDGGLGVGTVFELTGQ